MSSRVFVDWVFDSLISVTFSGFQVWCGDLGCLVGNASGILPDSGASHWNVVFGIGC